MKCSTDHEREYCWTYQSNMRRIRSAFLRDMLTCGWLHKPISRCGKNRSWKERVLLTSNCLTYIWLNKLLSTRGSSAVYLSDTTVYLTYVNVQDNCSSLLFYHYLDQTQRTSPCGWSSGNQKLIELVKSGSCETGGPIGRTYFLRS